MDILKYQETNNKLNPLLDIIVTDSGDIISKEEATFIHYYVVTNDAYMAYKQAGMSYPRKPISNAERRKLYSEGRLELLNNLLLNEEELTARLSAIEEKENALTTSKNTIYKKQLTKYQNQLDQIHNLTVEEIAARERQEASTLLANPAIRREILARIQAIKDNETANVSEVFRYFTAVMRGEVKDQFGLEASLQERTRAATELVKRLVDTPNKLGNGSENDVGITITVHRREEPDPIDADYSEK